MKLYTREQVKKVIIFLTRNEFAEEIVKNIVSDLTPIELPSDEEIEKEIMQKSTSFQHGAKWVIEKIKQQENE